MEAALITATATTITPATWALLLPLLLTTGGALYLWQSRTPPPPPSTPLIVDEAPAARVTPSLQTAVVPAVLCPTATTSAPLTG